MILNNLFSLDTVQLPAFLHIKIFLTLVLLVALIFPDIKGLLLDFFIVVVLYIM